MTWVTKPDSFLPSLLDVPLRDSPQNVTFRTRGLLPTYLQCLAVYRKDVSETEIVTWQFSNDDRLGNAILGRLPALCLIFVKVFSPSL